MACGGLQKQLTDTGGPSDSRWRWKDLLNPTNTQSLEETEAVGSEVGALISGAEVAEAVNQLCSSDALGVDEIRPGYLKALDVVGLSWLTQPYNIAWTSGEGQYLWSGKLGWWSPSSRKGTRGCVPNYRGITLLSLPGKVSYARVLERRVRPIVEPQIQERTMWFSSLVVEQWTSSLEGARRSMGVCPTSLHVFFRSGEGLRPCVPRGTLWGALREYGVDGPLLRAIQSLYVL
ncbi:hypothetical protein L3Q82_017204 [Scortum barcoo]|uniref:Uncharacterized protein n=1 Tax=Scortum barcoo TaxID=214431 RepID=A0ACB8VLF3_9TELE|nr:hypothetical protein L3Q82_017204 [Scortum barcoo]